MGQVDRIHWDYFHSLISLGRHTFNSWIILIDEMALDILDGQARLANTAATNNNELVFSEELVTC